MHEDFEQKILRYARQTVLKAMDHVRSQMRGSHRLALKEAVANDETTKDEANLTKGVDREAEDLIVKTLARKIGKIDSVEHYTVFSEELGIRSFPEAGLEDESDLVIFVDPIDGTEFIENLQGGWVLMGIYDRQQDRVLCVAAGDIFLDRLYWASANGFAECIDLVTHSWFKLEGSSRKKTSLHRARVNILTTKPGRFKAVTDQAAFFQALEQNDSRINLSYGSNLVIQVAAGYADAAVEFAKGFATYDILPGLFIGQRAGLTMIDLDGNPLSLTLDIPKIFEQYRKDSSKPHRTKFIVAQTPELAHEIQALIVR